MENRSEAPEFPGEDLAEKRKGLEKAVELMLDWQVSDKIKKSLLPHVDSFTGEELDYLLAKVKNLDNQMQLRGPLAETARMAKGEDKERLEKIEENITPDRLQELEKMLEGIETD